MATVHCAICMGAAGLKNTCMQADRGVGKGALKSACPYVPMLLLLLLLPLLLLLLLVLVLLLLLLLLLRIKRVPCRLLRAIVEGRGAIRRL